MKFTVLIKNVAPATYNGAQRRFKIADGTEFDVWTVTLEFVSQKERKTPETLAVEYARNVNTSKETPFKSVMEKGAPVLVSLGFSAQEYQGKMYNRISLYRVMSQEE